MLVPTGIGVTVKDMFWDYVRERSLQHVFIYMWSRCEGHGIGMVKVFSFTDTCHYAPCLLFTMSLTYAFMLHVTGKVHPRVDITVLFLTVSVTFTYQFVEFPFRLAYVFRGRARVHGFRASIGALALCIDCAGSCFSVARDRQHYVLFHAWKQHGASCVWAFIWWRRVFFKAVI